MRNILRAGLCIALTLCGCSDHDDFVPTPRTHVARTGGSAVALSADERVAVVANRSAGVVSVLALDPAQGPGADIVTRKIELDTGAGSEPWAAVVGIDDDTAYVLFRQSQRVGKLVSLHGNPVLEASVSVGSEPSGIAISPSGEKLFVANWGEGTISVITTSDFVQQVKIDLNVSLVQTNVLGDIEPRVALAHPRALAITDNGDADDTDETLYATEFFSQPLPGVPALADLTQVDRNRQGFVYPVSLKTGQPGNAISIAPVSDTGFAGGDGKETGCFPNQLYAAAVDHDKLFVTSMCTSPRGPLGKSADPAFANANFKTLLHPALFVIDTNTNQELPSKGRLLTQVLESYYSAGEEATSERMPLIPDDIAFSDATADAPSAFVSALGADALYRVDYDSGGTLQQIGDAGSRYIDLKSRHGLPIGVAVSKVSKSGFALAVNDTNQSLSVVDLASEAVSIVPLVTEPGTERAQSFKQSDENQGHAFFATGRDIWSLNGQAWSSCESCHPGGLSDGVTWFFTRGPRRTLSTASTYDKTGEFAARQRRLLLWGANIDEVHDVEAIVRGVSGGAGAALWAYAEDQATSDCRLVYDGTQPAALGSEPCQAWKPTSTLENGLNGALSSLDQGTDCDPSFAICDKNSLPDWHMIEAFLRSERAPRAPTPLSTSDSDAFAADIEAGHQLFQHAKCAGCHGGSGWTVSRQFYKPGPNQNGELPSVKPSLGPLQLGALRQTRYTVPLGLVYLNPPAREGMGSATFRAPVPAELSGTALIDYMYTGAGANQTDDQIRCALRDVGTFPAQAELVDFTGVAPAGAPGVFEYRSDMHSLSQGASGFNVPSLFGLAVGAPFFHAGNARTLEELFDTAAFSRHHQAFNPNFLVDSSQRKAQVKVLVAYLLSIDETTAIEAPPIADFCQP